MFGLVRFIFWCFRVDLIAWRYGWFWGVTDMDLEGSYTAWQDGMTPEDWFIEGWCRE